MAVQAWRIHLAHPGKPFPFHFILASPQVSTLPKSLFSLSLPSPPFIPLFSLLNTFAHLWVPLRTSGSPFQSLESSLPPAKSVPSLRDWPVHPGVPLSKPGRPACPVNCSRCARRAALRDLSPGPRGGSGGQGRDVTAGRGRGSGRAGGSRGRCFPALKRQKAEPGPASE